MNLENIERLKMGEFLSYRVQTFFESIWLTSDISQPVLAVLTAIELSVLFL